MQAREANTIFILRRMKRTSIGKLPWNSFRPSRAKPEELRFDVLDDKEKVVGRLEYTKVGFNPLKWEHSVMSTPWGEGIIRPEKAGFQFRILMDGKELFCLKETGAVLKKGIQLTAPDGVKFDFKLVNLPGSNLEYSDGKGYIGLFEEHGSLAGSPAGHPIALTKEEIKRLPKADRPSSVESLDYVQFRVKAGGVLPPRLDDIVAAIFMWTSYGRLINEIPT